MRILTFLIPACALLAQSQTPVAQSQTPNARSLLMRSGGSVLMADTLRLEGTETDDVVLPGTRTTTTAAFVLERSTGGRMRLEISVANSKSLVIADGENVWTYLSVTQTYMKLHQSNVPENDEFGRLKFSRDPADFKDARIDREESLAFAGQHVPCYVVHAIYSSMPGSRARDATRGLHGTYVSVEPYHLFRYLDEQCFRFNKRSFTDADRFLMVCNRVTGKRLDWKTLTGKNDAGRDTGAESAAIN